MKKSFKRLVALIAVSAIAVSSAACKKEEKAEQTNNITYWCSLDGNTVQTASSLGDTHFAKELMERVGCTIEYQHPASGQAAEKFNILTAMKELPDIIEFYWDTAYPGGGKKALDDGIIMEIDMKNDAPNLYAYLQQHPEVDKLVKTDDGRYFGFPMIRGDEYLQTYIGPIVRKDWLDELGLEEPETIDEWTTMLRAFKEKKNVVAPLTITLNNMNGFGVFSGAYGTYHDLYVQDGVVKYGPLDDSYKEYLKLLNDWYEEGLLDADFASVDGTTIQGNILNGISGATAGSCGGNLGKWLSAGTAEGFDLAGVKYPVLKKGEKPQFAQMGPVVDGMYAAITKDCKNYELCVKLLDYGYSEEGHNLFNFGIEGESYTMVDGYPTYTENVTNNPDGLSMSASMAQYCRSHNTGAFIQDRRYMEQYAQLPQQKEALNNWLYHDMNDHMMPTLNLTSEQETELASSIEAISTYKNQMQMKFITGAESLDNYDEFIKGLKERNIDKYIKYYQQAYDRFMKK